MDIHGEDSFRAKSYSIAAYNIEQLPAEAAAMSQNELFAAKGIGQSTGKKIQELLQTGQLAQLEEMISRTPSGILDMLKIKGLGPKKIAVIWNELEIESVGELEYACNENRLVTLKGFGAKTQASILESIAYIRQNQGYYLWADAIAIAQNLCTRLRQQFPDHLFDITGDLRRQSMVTNVMELLTTVPPETMAPLLSAPEISLDSIEGGLEVKLPMQPLLRIRYSPLSSYYRVLFEQSASDEFLAAFKEQYAIPESAASEEAVFSANGLQYIVPALREEADILQLAAKGSIPELITEKDIKAIIHSHSKWSDGSNTLEEMAKAARDKGFEYLVISDHSQTATYASGLKPDRVAAQHIEIDALNARLAPFRIFKSIESDILGDGSLDYTDSVLGTFDLVIASVHSNLKMSQERAMGRLLAAIANPFTNILGHPTGRLLLSRAGYPVDHKVLIDACAEHNVVIEINAHPRRLDVDWRWIGYAMERGVLLSVDPDAHSIEGFKDVYHGVIAAQKGGLTAGNNLSSFSLAQFEQFLEGQKKKRYLE